MSYHWKWLGLILAYMAGVARADPWDDFANNLFSDLAPLLALFGERATMQFMSQSLGWEDCVILALAPLGIITILVSAIRVGGPTWLKAVVGRARENISAAEMELMSSTSKEVCELSNGQTIVRCQGSTPVWEFIYLIPTTHQNQAQNENHDIKAITLEDACKTDKRLLHKLGPPRSTSKIVRIFHRVLRCSAPPSTGDDSLESGDRTETAGQPPSETIYVIRNMSSDAPNIILNLQNDNSDRKDLKAYAMIGVILQLCVLAFFGIITYHLNVRNSFRKDDQRVDDYAFPLAISGTLVLVFGVFLCGIVVEASTHETRYKKNENYEMRIVWIQQKQTVGDQVFEPFAIFPEERRDVVTMSRRGVKPEILEPLTIIGICTGLAGFIIQFIGLRGMNSTATLAQLGAVGIMRAIRAWVRRRLAKHPDTLAWALTLLNHSHLKGSGLETSPTGRDRNPDPVYTAEEAGTHREEEQHPRDSRSKGRFLSLGEQSRCSWSLSTGGDVDHQPFLESRPRSTSRAQQVFESRWNLTRLAQFKGASAAEAVNLATAVVKIMSVLFSLSSRGPERAWPWPLAVVYRDSESVESECHVNISLTGKDGVWKALADQLESVLSLCLFTTQKEQNQAQDGQAEFNLNNEDDDWLRQKTMNSGLSIRLFGSKDAKKTDQLIQDLRWWAPETFDILAEIQEVMVFHDENEDGGNEPVFSPDSGTKSEREAREKLNEILQTNPKWNSVRIGDNRVVGYGPARLQSQSRGTRQRLFQNFAALSEPERREKRRGTLAIESNDSLEKLFAKDLLFSFLISAAKTRRKPLRTKVTTRESTARSYRDYTSKALVANELNLLATEFGHFGYGTEQEAWLSIIAPLSIAEKLPFPRPMIDLARERAGKTLLNYDLTTATQVCLALWKQTQRFETSAREIRGWGTAFLVEQLRHLEYEIGRTALEGDSTAYHSKKAAADDVYEALRASGHQQSFLAHLLGVYERQGRPLELEGIKELAGLTLKRSFPDYFGITELHLKAMDPSDDSFRDCDEEVWKSINERDVCDWTPLHYASATRNHKAVTILLRRGADPNIQSLDGFTPVHYFCEGGYQINNTAALRDRWRLDARGLDGATPVHVAARTGNLDFIKSVNRWDRQFVWGEDQGMGLNFDLRDYQRRLPIHWAVMYGHEDVVKILKNAIDEPDNDG
ncbi:hypothetical protein NCS52_00789300 [Fusarium sp. LHS14.1]|nr:hypothetical protein NCS52_00789300 [Fusarium sp. LHS14.1]